MLWVGGDEGGGVEDWFYFICFKGVVDILKDWRRTNLSFISRNSGAEF